MIIGNFGKNFAKPKFAKTMHYKYEKNGLVKNFSKTWFSANGETVVVLRKITMELFGIVVIFQENAKNGFLRQLRTKLLERFV